MTVSYLLICNNDCQFCSELCRHVLVDFCLQTTLELILGKYQRKWKYQCNMLLTSNISHLVICNNDNQHFTPLHYMFTASTCYTTTLHYTGTGYTGYTGTGYSTETSEAWLLPVYPVFPISCRCLVSPASSELLHQASLDRLKVPFCKTNLTFFDFTYISIRLYLCCCHISTNS